MKQIGSQKKLKKKIYDKKTTLKHRGGSAGLVKDHTFTFFFGTLPIVTFKLNNCEFLSASLYIMFTLQFQHTFRREGLCINYTHTQWPITSHHDDGSERNVSIPCLCVWTQRNMCMVVKYDILYYSTLSPSLKLNYLLL